MSQRRRRVTDLFIRGTEVALPDGSYLWIQVLNGYEREEAIQAAQVARARLVLALQKDGEERTRIEGIFYERGRTKFIDEFAEAKSALRQSDFVAELEDDPDWAERTRILFETDFSEAAKPAEASEEKLMVDLSEEWFAELSRRLGDEKSYVVRHLSGLNDEDLLDEYFEYWIEQRGSVLAQAEYSLVEIWKVARFCEAKPNSEGLFDHSECDGHVSPLFESKVDARSAPDDLLLLIREGQKKLLMSTRDPKGSASRVSSSASSPPVSDPVAEVPSTSTETQESPRGISVQQLATL